MSRIQFCFFYPQKNKIMAEECPICVNRYHKVRTPVTCSSCASAACTHCTKTFLLGNTVEAKCMSCQSAWDMEFVRASLSKNFLDGEYRRHQVETLLAEAETTVGNLQVLVPIKRRLEELDHEKREQRRTLLDVRREVHLLKAQKSIAKADTKTKIEGLGKFAAALIKREKRARLQEVTQTLLAKMHDQTTLFWQGQDLQREFYRNQVLWRNNGRPRGGVAVEAAAPEEPKAEFFMACPGKECRGRLSTAYKCGLCEHFFCADCHGDKGVHRDAPDHHCRQEDTDTVTLLRQNTKPCPNCHEGIYKASGCDQMWCVRCHRCFSWNTGKLLNGTIHNPHYYEYQRQLHGGDDPPRVPGDIPCGGLPNFGQLFARAVTMGMENADLLYMEGLHQLVNHLLFVVVPGLQHRVERDVAEKHRTYGVAYLDGTLSRDEWGQKLYLAARKRERKQRIHHVLEMMTTVSADVLRNWLHGNSSREEMVQSLKTLVEYVNSQIALQNRHYGTHTRTVDPLSDAYYYVV